MLESLLFAAFTLAHSPEAAHGLAPDAVRAPVTVDAAWIEPGRDPHLPGPDRPLGPADGARPRE